MTNCNYRAYLYYFSLFFIVLGISLRLIIYFINRPLWLDEIYLSLNIINCQIDILCFSTLQYNQGAPLGFLFLTKLLQLNFGNSEYVLRLLPLIFGILSVIAFYKFSQKVLDPLVVPISVGLYSLSYFLIYYSSEVKQYSSDVFIAIILLYLGIKLYSETLHTGNIILAILVGSLSIWFSHPAVFILAGIGSVNILYNINNKAWNNLFICTIIFSFWAVSFLGCYVVSLSKIAENQFFFTFWENYFFEWSLFSLKNIKIFLDNISVFADSPRWTYLRESRALYFVPILLGGISLYKKDKYLFLFLISIVMFTMIVSLLKKYPFSGRLALFLSPISILFAAQGFGTFINYFERKKLNYGLYLVIFILSLHFLTSVSYVIWPSYKEDTRSIFTFIKENYDPDEKIYLYNYARFPFMYYRDRFLFLQKDNIIIGSAILDDGSYTMLNNFSADLDHIKNFNKIWIVFSHLSDEERDDILAKIAKHGSIEKKLEVEKAYTYLVNFKN